MKLFGLVGKHLSHSFSPSFFEEYFQSNGIAAEYRTFEIEEISKIQKVFSYNPSGLNVTVPYKEAIIPYLDELDETAQKIQAVNTISFKEGKKIGQNTDAIGFKRMVQPFLTSKHERALLIGTGGASKAVSYVLNEIGIEVFYISRSSNLGDHFFQYQDLNAQMIHSCKLIVHCTPMGMYPNTDYCVPMPYESLTSEHLVVDLIYNPEKTLFLQKSEHFGAQTLNGLSMLKEQALESWKKWN